MKINVEIVAKAIVHDPKKIETLREKELVTNMMLRRRLSRSSKILINLADQCGFTQGMMIYGSAYGELGDTAAILHAIKDHDTVNPSAFQNSVYNTPASYHSILQKNRDEILTLSCGDDTSHNVMQQGALALLQREEVFVCAIETLDFQGVEMLNRCTVELEYGIAFLIKKTEKKANISVKLAKQTGVPVSLLWMKALYDASLGTSEAVIEVEL
jgi:hypothetical protein